VGFASATSRAINEDFAPADPSADSAGRSPLRNRVDRLSKEIPHAYVRIELLKGRSSDQKQRLAEAVTAALVDIAKARADQVSIVFQDVEPSDWALDGRLLSDK
jgi:4-oxalocrotonate tautomerase